MREAVISKANCAWEQLERGDISVDEFAQQFNDECSDVVSSLLYFIIS